MLNIINHHWNIPFLFGSYLVYLQIWSFDFDHSTRWRDAAAWGRTVVVQTGTQPPAAVPLPLLNPITSSLGATRMQCQASEEYEINQVLPGNLIKKSKSLRKKNTFHTIFQHNPRCHTPVKSTPEVEVIKRYTNDWNAHVPWPCSATTCLIAVPYMDGFCIFV